MMLLCSNKTSVFSHLNFPPTAMPYTEATQQALRAGVETVRLALEPAPVPERPQKALSRYSRQDLLQVCSKSASVFPFLILASLV